MTKDLVVDHHWLNGGEIYEVVVDEVPEKSAPLKTEADYKLVLEFKAPDLTFDVAEKKKRPPMDMVVVLDTSGSMKRDNKMGTLRSSMEEIIKWLGPEDRLGIVTFADTAIVRVPLAKGSMLTRKARATALKTVDELKAVGNTNMEAGLKSAFDEFDADIIKSVKDKRPSAIIFMSDGIQNVGDVEKGTVLDLIKKGHIHVDTIGFGKDHQPQILSTIAKRCGGVYNNVWNPTYLTSACSSLVYFLSHTVVMDLKLTIQQHTCSIKRLQLGLDDIDVKREDIVVGSIGACANRKLTVTFTLKDVPADKEMIHNSSVMTVRWEYWGGQPDNFGKDKHGDRTITIHRQPKPTTRRVRSLVIPVQAQTEDIRLNHLAAIEAVHNLANQGKIDQAQEKLVEARDKLSCLRANTSKELKDYVGSLYDEVQYLFGAVVSYDSYDKQGGRHCFLATLSSHNSQRHTMRGEDSHNIRLFVRTERLHRYLDEAMRFDNTRDN